MNNKENLLKKLQNMKEDCFSKEIIIPLLKKMGFYFADFNGGPWEHGVDIIAYKDNEFSDLEVTTCQSKKFRGAPSRNRAQFSEVITQLRMCQERKISCHDGIERIPDKVLFITPYVVSSRLVEEHFATYKLQKVKIIDGSVLLKLFQRYWPEAFDVFESSAGKATKTEAKELINSELNRALNINEEIDYQEYYSDLNFFVGNIDGRQVFSSNISIKKTSQSSYEEEDWLQLKSIHKTLKRQINIGILLDPIDLTERNYKNDMALFSSAENQEKIAELNALHDKISSDKTALSTLMKNLLIDINTISIRNFSKKANPIEANAKEFINTLALLLEIPLDQQGVLSISEAISQLQKNSPMNSHINNTIGLISNLANDLLGSFHDEREASKIVHPLPKFKAEIEVDLLCSMINHKIENAAEGLKKLNNRSLSAAETRSLLNEINSLLRAIDLLLRIDSQAFIKTELIRKSELNNTLDISAHSLFDSGCNITVYGEAGAGKSTTLHVYASKLLLNRTEEELFLFLPINRITSKINSLTNEERFFVFNTKSNFEKLLNGYLVYKGLSPNKENLDSIIDIATNKKKVVFIIDALDEAADHATWIVPALSELPSVISHAQVITSSRSTVQKVKEIEFLGITLLPFNENQLERFIFGYLKNDPNKENLWNDIKNNKLYEIAKNPLLATIICTLHKNGIQVPRNESEVYKRKIELLCGLYDNFKGIKRTKFDLTLLRESSRAIAYGMHKDAHREATIDEIKYHLDKEFSGKINSEKFDEIISDLHESCNILHYIPESKTYTFGHLRFQEYLASEMLSMKRYNEIVELASKSWWAGALYLYSFDNDLDDLFDRIYDRYGSFVNHRKILEVMITAQPTSKRPGLRQILDRNNRLDESEQLHDVIEGDYSYRDIYPRSW
ncbi:MAG TPA: hypothetical protein DF427_00370 [Moraxellaceae bacterium]|nr:hypothetical protein [Moraxellaceae bacterium]